jgi:AcrR family transcriptional regulator
VLLDVHEVGSGALARQEAARIELQRVIAASFEAAPGASALTPTVIRGIACGVERVVSTSLDGDFEQMPGVIDELVTWTLCYGAPRLEALAQMMPSELQGSAWQPSRPTGFRGERARLLRVAAELVACIGYQKLTAEKIAERAGVREDAFWATFESLEQCFYEALDLVGLEALTRVHAAMQGAEPGMARMRAGTAALLGQLAEDPVLRAVMFLERFPPGSPVIMRRERLLAGASDLLMRSVPCPPPSSSVIAQATAQAVQGVIRSFVLAGKAQALPALTPQVVYLLLAPSVASRSPA